MSARSAGGASFFIAATTAPPKINIAHANDVQSSLLGGGE
jgi:hypothetical protein